MRCDDSSSPGWLRKKVSNEENKVSNMMSIDLRQLLHKMDDGLHPPDCPNIRLPQSAPLGWLGGKARFFPILNMERWQMLFISAGRKYQTTISGFSLNSCREKAPPSLILSYSGIEKYLPFRKSKNEIFGTTGLEAHRATTQPLAPSPSDATGPTPKCSPTSVLRHLRQV